MELQQKCCETSAKVLAQIEIEKLNVYAGGLRFPNVAETHEINIMGLKPPIQKVCAKCRDCFWTQNALLAMCGDCSARLFARMNTKKDKPILKKKFIGNATSLPYPF